MLNHYCLHIYLADADLVGVDDGKSGELQFIVDAKFPILQGRSLLEMVQNLWEVMRALLVGRSLAAG